MAEGALITFSAAGDRPPVFLFAGLGGSVLPLAPLGRLLGSDRPCFGLDPRGIDGRREPLARVEAMAADHGDAIVRVHPRGACHLAGWSFGGLVAWEIASQLRRAGHEAAVALLDTQALIAADEAGENEDRPREQHHRRLVDAQRLARSRYHPRPFDGPACLIRASEASPAIAASNALGWDDLARGPFEIHSAPGDHRSMLSAPHVAALALLLRTFFDRQGRTEG
jgi:thioesterase domain-containing protein